MQVALLCKPMLAPNTNTITTRACRLVKIPKAPITAQRFEIEIMDAHPLSSFPRKTRPSFMKHSLRVPKTGFARKQNTHPGRDLQLRPKQLHGRRLLRLSHEFVVFATF